MLEGASSVVALAALAGAALILLRICWTDFFHLKIWNRDLLALFGVTMAYLVVARPDDLGLRLGLAAILFSVSFVFWLLHTLGAGDVKLFAAAGLLIDPTDAFGFVVLILVFVAAILIVDRGTVVLRFVPQVAGRRVLELVDTGRVPYGVPIALATIASLAPLLGKAL